MNHLPLIIKREYLNKVKNKSFIIMTILSPIIMIALFALVAYLSQINNNKERTISILDQSGLVAEIFKDTEHTKYIKLQGISLEDAIKQVQATETYGLLHIEAKQEPKDVAKNIKFYSQDSPSLSVISALEDKLENKLTSISLKQKGVDESKIKEAEAKVSIAQESFSGEKTSEIESYIKIGFGAVLGYLLFMFIIIYGNMIMRSIIEEKTSRIIEIIISSVKPIKLMMGKIIGTSLAGITQFAIWVILGSILMVVVTLIFGINMAELQTPQQELMQQTLSQGNSQEMFQKGMAAFFNLPLLNLIIAFILFFVGGYFLYSSLYAAIGAAVDNETDTQQFMFPIIMPLILAFYVGIFTVIEDPHGTISTIFSFVPFTSPVVMLMRIPFGVPLWQQMVSLLILVATFMLTVWFAAKIYRVGILMYGKKPSYKELYKWIKY